MERFGSKLAAFALSLIVAASTAAQDADGPPTKGPPQVTRPNVVLILADDLGYGDVEPFATDEAIPTPHFARLAREGLRMTDSHSPAAWCTPTRYSLLTGRYPHRRTKLRDSGPVIGADETTLPGWLAGRGYETTLLGKWHLGFDGDVPGGVHSGGPVDRGFDKFFGIPRSLDLPPYYWISGREAVDGPTESIEAGVSSKPWSSIQGAFWRAGMAAPSFEFSDVTPEIGDRAAAFLSLRNATDPPFFLMVSLPSPHTPWLPTDEFRGRSEAGSYGDFVAQVDSVVGDIVEAVDANNLAERTLIWVSSDNGPVWRPKDVGRTGHVATAGFRGMKGDAFEGGHRVPTVVRFPGYIGFDTASDALVCHTDLFATLAGMLGESLPEGTAEDSVNQWDVWTQENHPPVRTWLPIEATRGRQAVRDGRWKLIPWLGSVGFSKPVLEEPVDGGPEGQLYDLTEDPGETTNLYAERPEEVVRLKERLPRPDFPVER